MCSQNAGNVISKPPILKIFPGPSLESPSMSSPPPDKTKTPRLCYLIIDIRKENGLVTLLPPEAYPTRDAGRCRTPPPQSYVRRHNKPAAGKIR